MQVPNQAIEVRHSVWEFSPVSQGAKLAEPAASFGGTPLQQARMVQHCHSKTSSQPRLQQSEEHIRRLRLPLTTNWLETVLESVFDLLFLIKCLMPRQLVLLCQSQIWA